MKSADATPVPSDSQGKMDFRRVRQCDTRRGYLGTVVVMAMSRRLFCSLVAASPMLVGARSPDDARDGPRDDARDGAPAGMLRFTVLRHQTVLVEIDGRRVLFDPSFSRGLGLGPLLDAAEPSLRAQDLGDLDVLCVTTHAPGAFDAWATRALRGREAACLVADERTERALRGQGFSKVRVMRDGEEMVARGVTVRATAFESALGSPACAFFLERAGRTFWHVGAPLPLQRAPALTPPLVAFAGTHRAEVIAVCAQGLCAAGVPLTFDEEDADELAALCRARVEVRLGHDTHPSVLGSLLLDQATVPRMRARRASTARALVPISSTWYRVAPS